MNPIGELVAIPISSRWWARGTLLAVRLTPRGDEVSWHLRIGDGAPISEEQYDQFVPANDLNAVRERIGALLRAEVGETVVEAAHEAGHALYRLVVPRPLRDVLPTFDGELLIEHPPDFTIPWEMLHDGRDFWGRRYAIGRSVFGDFSLRARLQPQGGRHQMLVIGANATGNASFLDERMRQLCDLLGGGGPVVSLTGRNATAHAITVALRSQYDVIHVCGSTSRDLKLLLTGHGEYALDELVHDGVGQPLVVLDLLVDRLDPVWTPHDVAADSELARIARTLLAKGAIGVVGRVAGHLDRRDRVVLDRFYREAFDGVPLGQALRVARAACTDAKGHEVVGAMSLGLYGHPGSALRKRARIQRWHPFTGRLVKRSSRVRRWAPSVGVAAMVALVWMSPALRSYLLPAPRRFEVVVVDTGDERTRPLVRDVAMVLQNGLAAIGRSGGARIEIVAPRQLLCERRGSSRCEELIGEARPVQLVLAVEPSGPHGNAIGVSVDGVNADGTPAGISARTVEPLGGGRPRTDLLRKVVLQLHLPLDAVTVALFRPSDASIVPYELLRASLDETVVVPTAEDIGRTRRMAPLPLIEWPPVRFEPRSPRDEVRRLLEQYEAALERGVVDEVAAFQPGMRKRQRNALEKYLALAKDGLDVEFEDVDVTIAGTDAIVTATRLDRLITLGGEPLGPVRVALRLERREDGWHVVEPPTPMQWGVLTERVNASARRSRR